MTDFDFSEYQRQLASGEREVVKFRCEDCGGMIAVTEPTFATCICDDESPHSGPTDHEEHPTNGD